MSPDNFYGKITMVGFLVVIQMSPYCTAKLCLPACMFFLFFFFSHPNVILFFYASSVESQKGTITIQRCSVENQKGTIAIDTV